jgi:hypothetical protein
MVAGAQAAIAILDLGGTIWKPLIIASCGQPPYSSARLLRRIAKIPTNRIASTEQTTRTVKVSITSLLGQNVSPYRQ